MGDAGIKSLERRTTEARWISRLPDERLSPGTPSVSIRCQTFFDQGRILKAFDVRFPVRSNGIAFPISSANARSTTSLLSSAPTLSLRRNPRLCIRNLHPQCLRFRHNIHSLPRRDRMTDPVSESVIESYHYLPGIIYPERT